MAHSYEYDIAESEIDADLAETYGPPAAWAGKGSGRGICPDQTGRFSFADEKPETGRQRTFKTWRDPYGEGFATCRRKEVTVKAGLTVLCGCNGAGKTTLLQNIKDCLDKEGLPCVLHDGQKDGGTSSVGSMLFNGGMSMAAGLMTSSEGEMQGMNLGIFAAGIRKFIGTGTFDNGTRESGLANAFLNIFKEDAEEKKPVPPERWILIDATTSGMSVDAILEIKELIGLMAEDAEKAGVALYAVVAANEYEMAAGEDCIDATEGSHVRFKNYKEYRSFVLKTRKKKDRRTERATEKR